MTISVSSLRKKSLFGSLAVMTINGIYDFRPMALRHQVSLVLPFGSRSVLINPYGVDFRSLTLRHRLSAALLFSAVWQSWLSTALDPLTLRHRVSPVLLFIGADSIFA
jgi:hypothetical protein